MFFIAELFFGHSAGSEDGGDDIFGIGRNAMLVRVEAVEFAFAGNAKGAGAV